MGSGGEFWEAAFAKMQMAWGTEPTVSARLACDYFEGMGVKEVLIPGIGYGRNALPFLERGMSVTGIEVSETAIALFQSGRCRQKAVLPVASRK